jgi:hypothetical protein
MTKHSTNGKCKTTCVNAERKEQYKYCRCLSSPSSEPKVPEILELPKSLKFKAKDINCRNEQENIKSRKIIRIKIKTHNKGK